MLESKVTWMKLKGEQLSVTVICIKASVNFSFFFGSFTVCIWPL